MGEEVKINLGEVAFEVVYWASITSGCKIQGGVVCKKDNGVKGTMHKLTHSELKCWVSSSKSARDIWGVTELTNFNTRAAEVEFKAIFSRSEVQASKHHYSFIEPCPLCNLPSKVSNKSACFIKMANTICPSLMIP